MDLNLGYTPTAKFCRNSFIGPADEIHGQTDRCALYVLYVLTLCNLFISHIEIVVIVNNVSLLF